ncbi:glycosyltransferase family 4 protein [Tautonia plasticadhaerens]|uniref:D-inositol 3-phosphate glycosyltransferase n=1 Tax=Tautonia plasticadhaerens TaxID=2527974 RepID=A0A518GWT0_9BACT|nr:glycosyltransferase family 4 protein [Tautonia plasticadhaerens]QDV33056.1 D-inositol 3-phosphate glycosyltransferase [Tautonia plasticadhaerens]
MASEHDTIGLYYAQDGYVEPSRSGRSRGAAPNKAAEGAAGLMGRHVAGKEFLDAFFRFGRWSKLVALVPDEPSARAIRSYGDSQSKDLMEFRSVDVVELSRQREGFLDAPPAPVVHFPAPPMPVYAWARQRSGPASFCMTGVTHTLASLGGLHSLNTMVTAPFEPHDALICTSRAVATMVRAVTGTYCDYLRDRFGGTPRLLPRLETIPLGVDTEAYRPALPEERALVRQTLGIDDEEVVVLFVGRLSFHAKANPYAMYRALARAARDTGRKVHLLLSGWASNELIHKAFQDGARVFAPNLRVTIVDGTRPEYRRAVWDAADLYTSLSDNIQETFGLTITEAMACGLPVVASDWDGYRDQVLDGESGYLVPTRMVRDSLPDATLRLVLGEVNYDHFLGECSQAVAVDIDAATVAYSRLIADEELRRRQGRAGRKHALESFTWSKVIAAYEALWADLDEERRAAASRGRESAGPAATPSCYPPIERSFACYPTELLGDDRELVADDHAGERLDWLIKLPITNLAGRRRCVDPEPLKATLRSAGEPRSLATLDEELGRAGVVAAKRRPTIAWMLKYGLLRPARPLPAGATGGPAAGVAAD